MSEQAQQFDAIYGSVERALKHDVFLQKGQSRAMADWKALSKLLGEDFYKKIRDGGKATTLITKPPGELRNQNQRAVWAPQPRLEDVEALFLRGVCKVRANLAHHEKFVGTDADVRRDETLISEALFVLEAAIDQSSDLRESIKRTAPDRRQ
ncbi:MAG: hypothetical protein ABSD74_16170 [Rhizomicrobium sp.]